jgi:hypothetical protein
VLFRSARQRPEILLPANSGKTLGRLAPGTRQIVADLALLFVTAVWGGTCYTLPELRADTLLRTVKEEIRG